MSELDLQVLVAVVGATMVMGLAFGSVTFDGLDRWGAFNSHVLALFVVGSKRQVWKLLLWPSALFLTLCFFVLQPLFALAKGFYDAGASMNNWCQNLPD